MFEALRLKFEHQVFNDEPSDSKFEDDNLKFEQVGLKFGELHLIFEVRLVNF